MQIQERHTTIVAGDFHAAPGPGIGSERPSVGPYTFEELNKRGDWMKQWVVIQNFTALNTMFKKKKKDHTHKLHFAHCVEKTNNLNAWFWSNFCGCAFWLHARQAIPVLCTAGSLVSVSALPASVVPVELVRALVGAPFCGSCVGSGGCFSSEYQSFDFFQRTLGLSICSLALLWSQQRRVPP